MEKINTQYSKVVRLPDVYTDTGSDYSLPDYNGDIKKVLYATAAVVPAASFTDGDVITASGIVNYDIIYLDSENNIDRLSFTSDYDFPVKVDSERLIGSDIETRISSFTYRLFGPRKINAKATLQSEIRLIEESAVETVCDGESDDFECIKTSLSVLKPVFLSVREREYADNVVTLEGYMADEVEIIYTAADAVVESARVVSGGLEVKGYFDVSMLIKSENNDPVLYKKRIPFDETMDSDDLEEGMEAVCRATVSSQHASANPTDDGVDITVSIISDLSARCTGNTDLEIMRDAYLKSVESSNSYESFNYTSHLFTGTFMEKYSESVPIGDVSDSGVRDIVLMRGQGKITEIASAGNSITVSGEARLHGICSSVSDDGVRSFFTTKFNLPIKKSLGANISLPKDAKITASCQIHDLSASVDDDNIYIDAEMKIDVCAETDATEERLVGCVCPEGARAYEKESKITVYYPTSEDSLFTVAKAFHTSPDKVAADNALTESVMKSFSDKGALTGIERLIIK